LVPIRLPSNAFIFRLIGEPKGKDRPRVFGDVTITTPETKSAERDVWASFIEKYAGCTPLDEPVFLGAHFRTAHNHKNGRGRVDLDNMVKLVKDALNKHAYTDDHWVHRMNIELTVESDDPGALIVVAAIRDIEWFKLPGE
jgi:Holliday junction resolvase RusA-like endonuclease